MDSSQETSSTPRSGAGFVLAITLALFTFWGAGLVFHLYSYAVDPPMQRAAATAVTAEACGGDGYDAGACAPAIPRPKGSSTR